MPKADRVHSTPPTNTSAHTPISSRRGFLAQAAAVAAGGAALGVALPLPESAGASERIPDPIFSAIERHRELSARYDAAVSISGELEPGPAFEAAEEVSAATCNDLLDHADILIRSEPTSIAGVVALLRYIATLEEWEAPRDFTHADDEPGWVETFCTTMANVLNRIDGGSA